MAQLLAVDFAAGGLTAADTVVGGGGADTLWMTTAGTTSTAALVNVTGIEGVFLQAESEPRPQI